LYLQKEEHYGSDNISVLKAVPASHPLGETNQPMQTPVWEIKTQQIICHALH